MFHLVAIYRFNPDWSGKFVAEAIVEDLNSLLDSTYQRTGTCAQISVNVA